MSAHNVRITDRAHQTLRELANDEKATMQFVLEKAIERYRRESFLRAANEDYKRLRGDSAAWKQVMRERELLDRAIGDGLDSE